MSRGWGWTAECYLRLQSSNQLCNIDASQRISCMFQNVQIWSPFYNATPFMKWVEQPYSCFLSESVDGIFFRGQGKAWFTLKLEKKKKKVWKVSGLNITEILVIRNSNTLSSFPPFWTKEGEIQSDFLKFQSQTVLHRNIAREYWTNCSHNDSLFRPRIKRIWFRKNSSHNYYFPEVSNLFQFSLTDSHQSHEGFDCHHICWMWNLLIWTCSYTCYVPITRVSVFVCFIEQFSNDCRK